MQGGKRKKKEKASDAEPSKPAAKLSGTPASAKQNRQSKASSDGVRSHDLHACIIIFLAGFAKVEVLKHLFETSNEHGIFVIFLTSACMSHNAHHFLLISYTNVCRAPSTSTWMTRT